MFLGGGIPLIIVGLFDSTQDSNMRPILVLAGIAFSLVGVCSLVFDISSSIFMGIIALFCSVTLTILVVSIYVILKKRIKK